MENPSSENPSNSAHTSLQVHEDAVPMDADKEIWVTVDGYGPITFHEVIIANSAPDVTPINHFTAIAVRNLEIGEVWEDFGDAAIMRVAQP